MQLPLNLSLRPSRFLALLFLAMHGAALAAALLAALPLWLGLVAAVLLAVSAGLGLLRLSGPRSIGALLLRADGRLEWTRRNGERGEAAVSAQSTVTAALVVLLLQSASRSEALLILPDSLDSEALRSLRLWLRWRAELA